MTDGHRTDAGSMGILGEPYGSGELKTAQDFQKKSTCKELHLRMQAKVYLSNFI